MCLQQAQRDQLKSSIEIGKEGTYDILTGGIGGKAVDVGGGIYEATK